MRIKWLETFPARAEIIRAIRMRLRADGYVEVTTPVRIPAPANELHICPNESEGWFLRASPELQMKRLLALGMEKLYQIGPCFRRGERGARHAPEFTMLEWYCANADCNLVISEMRRFVCAAARAVNGSCELALPDGSSVNLAKPWSKITVRDAMLKYAGWDPLENFDQDRFDTDMALKVEPGLPKDRVCIMTDYPAETAALARLNPNNPRVAERNEVYIGGVELCNAFGELTDTTEQRTRFEEARNSKIACGETPMPMDEDFLSALSCMPRAAGAALGVDRLVMLLLGKTDINDVSFVMPRQTPQML